MAGTRLYALFTANQTTNYREILTAVDAGTNRTVWTFNATTAWTSANPRPTQSAPILANNLVIFGSQDGSVYAVNVADGTIAWWFPTGGPVQTVAAALERIVYVTAGTKLLFLDINGVADGVQGTQRGTGDLLHEIDAGSAITSSPVVADPYVYLSGPNNVSAYDRTFGGAPVWSFGMSSLAAGTPAILGNTITARRADGRVYGFDRLTGQVLWVRGGLTAPVGGEDVAAVNGRVYLSAVNGTTYDLVALDGTDGAVADRNTTNARAALGAPIAAGRTTGTNLVYVREGSKLLAYRGQPDLAVLATDIVFSGGTPSGSTVLGNLTVVVRNVGDEPAANVIVNVCEGPCAPGTYLASFTMGTPKPIKAGGRDSRFTPDRAWTVRTRHEIHVVANHTLTETDQSNNEAVAFIYVQAGPSPPPSVVGYGPYWLALLAGFGLGALVLFLPLRRLREWRK